MRPGTQLMRTFSCERYDVRARPGVVGHLVLRRAASAGAFGLRSRFIPNNASAAEMRSRGGLLTVSCLRDTGLMVQEAGDWSHGSSRAMETGPVSIVSGWRAGHRRLEEVGGRKASQENKRLELSRATNR